MNCFRFYSTYTPFIILIDFETGVEWFLFALSTYIEVENKIGWKSFKNSILRTLNEQNLLSIFREMNLIKKIQKSYYNDEYLYQYNNFRSLH